jgi:hypothetical protein
VNGPKESCPIRLRERGCNSRTTDRLEPKIDGH